MQEEQPNPSVTERADALRERLKEEVPVSVGPKSGRFRRNGPCPCGSKRKFKSCCLDKVRAGKYPRIDLDGKKEEPPTARVAPTHKLRRLVNRLEREIQQRTIDAISQSQSVQEEAGQEGE